MAHLRGCKRRVTRKGSTNLVDVRGMRNRHKVFSEIFGGDKAA